MNHPGIDPKIAELREKKTTMLAYMEAEMKRAYIESSRELNQAIDDIALKYYRDGVSVSSVAGYMGTKNWKTAREAIDRALERETLRRTGGNPKLGRTYEISPSTVELGDRIYDVWTVHTLRDWVSVDGDTYVGSARVYRDEDDLTIDDTYSDFEPFTPLHRDLTINQDRSEIVKEIKNGW